MAAYQRFVLRSACHDKNKKRLFVFRKKFSIDNWLEKRPNNKHDSHHNEFKFEATLTVVQVLILFEGQWDTLHILLKQTRVLLKI